MPPANDLNFLRNVLDRLRNAGVQAWVFGGWAEELRGLRSPGPHHDIDLLYRAEDFQSVDWFLAQSGLEEIRAKRFPHKRAFLVDEIMVELLLVQNRAGCDITSFFAGRYSLEWPPDTFHELPGGSDGLLRVAGPAALRLYRQQHERIQQAYCAYIA